MGSYSKNSSNIETMNTVQQLKGVRFGHKFPRHGLKLLHWLANDIIEIDSTGKMLAQQNPNHGEFGFHLFHDSERILPGVRLQSRYFEVGNLHSPGAHALPFKQCQTESDESNTDRIILRLDSGQVIGKVYITEHTPHRSSFSAEYTYCLSKNLIQAIRGKTLQNFMRQAGYVSDSKEGWNVTEAISHGPGGRATASNNEVKVDMLDLPEDMHSQDRVCGCIIL